MADILIVKVDETHAQIRSPDRSILMELQGIFTFVVPGHQFTPAFRNRVWDGKIRLLDLRTGKIYMGLVPYVEEYAVEQGYTVEYLPEGFNNQTPFSVQEAEWMVKSLNLHSNGKPIDIRDYQITAAIHAIQAHRSLILSPTASGKSLIIYTMIRYYLAKTTGNILLIVPTTSLVEQMYSDFQDYSSQTWWDAEEFCHRIYAGKEKAPVGKRVLISTWQSIYGMPQSYFDQFETIFGDEAHLYTAKSITGIMEKARFAKYRHGTTGTIQDSKTNTMVLEGLFGRIYKATTTKELMDNKSIAELNLKCLVLKYPELICKQMKRMDYMDEMDFLVSHSPRNKFICNLALSLKGNTLVLYQWVDKHGKPLFEMIDKKCVPERKRFFVNKDTPTLTREEIRHITEEEISAIIVASYGTFSTGVNIKNIDNVIFASPTKSKIRVLQSVGRGLRLSERKTHVTLFDISDDLTYKSWKNFSLRHFVERVKFYIAEKFSYKIYNINLG